MNKKPAEVVAEYGPFPGVDRVAGVSYDGRHVWFASGDKLNALDPDSGKIKRSIDVTAHAEKTISNAGLRDGICTVFVAHSTCGVTIIEHSGSDIGDHTVAFFIPKKQIGAVIFTNGDNGPKLMAEIIRTLYPDPIYAYIESK